jgi:hypothetical protein
LKGIKRKILIGYILVASLGLILLFTGYSFRWDILDYLTIGIIVLYPIIKVFQFLKTTWLFVPVVVFSIIGLCFAGYYIILIGAFYTAGDKKEIQTWTLDNYKIELTYRQDWSGPAYFRYDLKRTSILNIFEKTLARSYPGSMLQDTCLVDFKKFYN